MRSWIRVLGLLAGAALPAASCGAAATPTPAPTSPPTAEPTAAPTEAPTPRPTAKPTPPPVPATDGEGDEAVVGTQSGTITTSYTMERVGDVLQYRDGVATTTDTMNDVRVAGTGTYTFSLDAHTVVGSEWATYRLENAGGSWEGPCTGATYMDDITSIVTCWLVGSGEYAGYTYYQFREGEQLQGVIYKGSPPPTPTP
jgi:hypothetical protein